MQVLTDTIHNAFPVVEELNEMVSNAIVDWPGLALASAV